MRDTFTLYESFNATYANLVSFGFLVCSQR
nr:MAG TPA: hypothetical protein [Caudoviricetes sp.]